MGKRDDIVEATKALLWEKGYEATSPRDIQERSNAGQGSFYHHFASKQALAALAIQEVVDERIQDFEDAMTSPGSFIDRFLKYVAQNQQPLLGCRVGRLVWDSAVQEEELRLPLAHYFRHLETRITGILEDEQKTGNARLSMPADQIALLVVSIVQGSFAVSRAMKHARAGKMRSALQAFLRIAMVEK